MPRGRRARRAGRMATLTRWYFSTAMTHWQAATSTFEIVRNVSGRNVLSAAAAGGGGSSPGLGPRTTREKMGRKKSQCQGS